MSIGMQLAGGGVYASGFLHERALLMLRVIMGSLIIRIAGGLSNEINFVVFICLLYMVLRSFPQLLSIYTARRYLLNRQTCPYVRALGFWFWIRYFPGK
jgi:hypothetical protein